ncbi:hypothetical protein [Paenibacillus cremeus]|uniref:Uncharacterized protein n=1 Tax=Paenibacillus cremeus TaxID=2163881 RepID=A0A559JNL9_9BACL|nr:hypothetical protein [Paenibacillus cremeus]TVY01480.1 hypothetical protein FPZ49_32290 [Paenibacillus cremeus]
MNWNVEVFRQRLNNRGVQADQIEQLLDTLKLIIERFTYHSKVSQNIWRSQFETNEYRFNSPAARRPEFETESNFIASLQAIHPIADIMGQIINGAVLNNLMAIHQVSLQRIKTALEADTRYINILTAVNDLIESQEYKFLDGFVNTIKHRKLIETLHHGEFGPNTEQRNGLKTEEFSFRQNTFAPMWIDDVIDNYIGEVIDKTMTIGNAINDYLQ